MSKSENVPDMIIANSMDEIENIMFQQNKQRDG